jgi:sulfofructosephosphate aldolase
VAEPSLDRIASPRGVLCVLALDHRDALRNAFRRAGVDDVGAETMLETKLRIVEAVGDLASGMLLDHAAAGRSSHDVVGLLVPLERQGHELLEGGRVNELEFTAEDALRVGADGCKLLLHYRADHALSAARQRELVARAAEDCHDQGLPLVLEPLVYRLEGEGEDVYRAAFADLVVAGAEDLAGSGADLLKLQFPGDRASCERLTRASAPLAWALLGGSDVDGDEFALQLETACRAGAGGFLAGRTIWGGALGLRPSDQQRWLQERARPLFQRLAAIAHDEATSSIDVGLPRT